MQSVEVVLNKLEKIEKDIEFIKLLMKKIVNELVELGHLKTIEILDMIDKEIEEFKKSIRI